MKKIQTTLHLKRCSPSWLDDRINKLIKNGGEICQVIPLLNFDSIGTNNWLIIYWHYQNES